MVGLVIGAGPGWGQTDGPSAVPQDAAKQNELTEETAKAQVGQDGQTGESQTGAQPPRLKTWSEMVENWMTVRPVAKSGIVRIDEQYCYPHRAVSFKMEIVREDDDTVWVRGLPPEDPESAMHKMWLRREATQQDTIALREFVEEEGYKAYMLDFAAEIVPPPFMDSLKFVPSSSQLPSQGLWQMNFAIDDMNGDGEIDLVFPPTRKGSGRPFIFLGKGGGEFKYWDDLVWPKDVPFDYGGVATGDFDGDGHRDMVLAIHFRSQYVLFGDGKGSFERTEKLPRPDPRISSRAPAVADFNGDGREDVAFLAEVDLDLGSGEQIKDAISLWVVLNKGQRWQLDTSGLPEAVIGDNLGATDVDGDGRIDLVLAPGTIDIRRLVYFNRGEAGWEGPVSEGVLSAAYHFDVDVWGEGEEQQLFATFVQFNMVAGRNKAVTGVIPYRLGEDSLLVTDGPLFYDRQRFNPVFRIAVGDINGDGRPDIVAGRKGGGLEVFLQTDAGDYSLEKSAELGMLGRSYQIRLVDLDGDGRDDLIATFAPVEERPGGVRVWLTRENT
jgi:hypothetical protein